MSLDLLHLFLDNSSTQLLPLRQILSKHAKRATAPVAALTIVPARAADDLFAVAEFLFVVWMVGCVNGGEFWGRSSMKKGGLGGLGNGEDLPILERCSRIWSMPVRQTGQPSLLLQLGLRRGEVAVGGGFGWGEGLDGGVCGVDSQSDRTVWFVVVVDGVAGVVDSLSAFVREVRGRHAGL
jgi:hypothetical protein